MLIFPFRIMLSETIYHVILTAQFYARILFIFVNIYCQPSIRFLGNLEKFPFFIMSSLDHEYNNFSRIQFLLSIVYWTLSTWHVFPRCNNKLYQFNTSLTIFCSLYHEPRSDRLWLSHSLGWADIFLLLYTVLSFGF